MIHFKTPCEGWFSFSAFRVDEGGVEIPGSRRVPVPPFKNLITDAGLNRMGDSADWLTWCQVGSGSTAPSVSDTALVSRVAGSNTKQASALTAQPSPPYYIARTNTYRFAAGVAAGNLSEVAVGWASTASLFSRALILDALGAPTTITVLADELLDVTYQFRQYAPEVEGSFDLTLRGVAHSVVSRPSQVNLSTPIADGNGWLLDVNGASAGAASVNSSRAYDGSIGAATAIPSGAASAATSATPLAYSAASLQRDIVVGYGNAQANFALGIGAITARLGIGFYQFGFTPKIMKTANDTLSLTFRHSWSRKTI